MRGRKKKWMKQRRQGASCTHLPVVLGDAVHQEARRLEGVAPHEGLEADAGVLEPDQCEAHLPLDVLELGTQLLGGEHTQANLFQLQLQVGEVVPAGDTAGTVKTMLLGCHAWQRTFTDNPACEDCLLPIKGEGMM